MGESKHYIIEKTLIIFLKFEGLDIPTTYLGLKRRRKWYYYDTREISKKEVEDKGLDIPTSYLVISYCQDSKTTKLGKCKEKGREDRRNYLKRRSQCG